MDCPLAVSGPAPPCPQDGRGWEETGVGGWGLGYDSFCYHWLRGAEVQTVRPALKGVVGAEVQTVRPALKGVVAAEDTKRKWVFFRSGAQGRFEAPESKRSFDPASGVVLGLARHRCQMLQPCHAAVCQHLCQDGNFCRGPSTHCKPGAQVLQELTAGHCLWSRRRGPPLQ